MQAPLLTPALLRSTSDTTNLVTRIWGAINWPTRPTGRPRAVPDMYQPVAVASGETSGSRDGTPNTEIMQDIWKITSMKHLLHGLLSKLTSQLQTPRCGDRCMWKWVCSKEVRPWRWRGSWSSAETLARRIYGPKSSPRERRSDPGAEETNAIYWRLRLDEGCSGAGLWGRRPSRRHHLHFRFRNLHKTTTFRYKVIGYYRRFVTGI